MKQLSRYYRESLSLLSTENGQTFLSLLYPYLRHPSVLRLSEYSHHMATDRLQHAVSVAYMTFCLYPAEGDELREICAAALLHDLFYFDRDHGGVPHFAWFRHPRLARDNAQAFLPLTPLGEDIILRHMFPLTGRRPRTPAGRLVSLLDKYCAVREFFLSVSPHSRSRAKNERNF